MSGWHPELPLTSAELMAADVRSLERLARFLGVNCERIYSKDRLVSVIQEKSAEGSRRKRRRRAA